MLLYLLDYLPPHAQLKTKDSFKKKKKQKIRNKYVDVRLLKYVVY